MKTVTFIRLGLYSGLILVLIAGVGCSKNRRDAKEESGINRKASLTVPNELPFNPLVWRVISSGLSQLDSSMCTLYGNDLAVNQARPHPGARSESYPVGAVLALVTWSQEEDPHWFGARIPHEIQLIEFVTVTASLDQKPSYSYQLYRGPELKKAPLPDPDLIQKRIDSIVNQRALVMP